MALPSSGAISLNDVNVELGNSGTAQIDMGSAAVRGLFGVASGAISMSNGYGKSSQFTFTISSNVTSAANLRTLAVNAGWNQSSKVVATIASGVYISSDSTGSPALTVNGSWPGGVDLVNNGIIVGRGGNGGNAGAGSAVGQSGGTGGGALLVSSAITITNNGSILGGGGGGGGGGSNSYNQWGSGGGGGQSSLTNSSGGSGASSGSAGTYSAPGNGGPTVTSTTESYGAVSRGGYGGRGGYHGAAGVNGGAANVNNWPGGGGGAGGYAVSGNSNVTWVTFGTRTGGIS